MNDTLRTLRPLVTPELNELTLEQLADAYPETLNPSVLATAFSKVFKLIVNVSHRYFGFDQSDIASYSLQSLDKALQTYDRGKGAFTTYFTTVFMNKLREESQKLSTSKRKAFMYSTSYEALLEDNFDIVSDDEQTIEQVLWDIEGYGLSEKEIQYCKYVMEGYTNKDIAKVMQTSIMTLCNIRKKLRIKLHSMCL